MALSRALILVALTATIFSTMAVAEDFIVGDNNGWTTWFDYKAWAANKVFRVGDTLTFKYGAWKDNVIRVNGSDFIKCSVPRNAQVWSSGHDTIVLTSTGRRWYISGVGDHCKSGQKLVITVLPPQGPWWSPTPSPLAPPSPKPAEVVLTPTPEPAPAPAPASVLPQEGTWSWSPTPSPFASPSPSPSPIPAELVLTPTFEPPLPSVLPPQGTWSWSPVPSPSADEVVLTPTSVPAPAPAPWTASVPHFGRRQLKKLFKIVH